MVVFRRLRTKMLLMALVVSLVPLAAVGAYGYLHIARVLRRGVVDETRARLERAALRLEGALEQTASDVLFLSRLPELRQLAEADPRSQRAAELKRRVQLVFAAFAQAKGIYHQVRYLDRSGREVVRVDFDRDRVRIVPEEELQNKAHRYYFTAAMKLDRGKVFVSPLDLNRERGALEVPHRPTMRYATCLFDPAGERRGIVITNLHARALLEEARAALEPRTGPCFLADEEGYYLMHSDPSRAWGGPRDLNTGAGLRRDLPGLWETILRCRVRQLEVPGGTLFILPVHPPPGESGRRWVLGKVYSRERMLAPLRVFQPIFFGFLAGAVVLSVLLAVALARRVTAPLSALRAGAERIGRGDLDYSIPITTGDETGALAAEFNAMAQRLKAHISDLADSTAARERTESELRIARNIQKRMLPAGDCPLPPTEAFLLCARYRPAREVGGDFYNLFPLDGRRLVLVVGDVVGKGVPAALVMAVTQTLIRTHAEEAHSPAEVLQRTNRALFAQTESDVFVTALVGFYRTDTGRLLWANAGHPPPLLLTAQGEVRVLDGSDLVLGVAGEGKFDIRDRYATLQPGSRLLLYSDGITEAADRAGRLFGSERLKAFLENNRDLSTPRLCEGLLRAVLEHGAGRPQTDDITILALEVRRLEGEVTTRERNA